MKSLTPPTPAHPKKNPLRWQVFTLMIVTTIGHYICIALPPSLEKYFHSDDYGLSHTQTSTFSSITMFPAIICAMLGGALSDKFGIAKCRFYFIVMATIGQLVVTLSCWLRSYPLMITGRILYGTFSEGYQVSSGALVVKYFKNAELFLSMAALTSVGRIATSFTYWSTPKLMNSFVASTTIPQSITIIMCLSIICMIVGCICALIVWMMDHKTMKKSLETEQSGDSVNDHGVFVCKHFGFSYWILVLFVIPFTYAVTWGWSYLAPKYLQSRFGLSDSKAGNIMSIVPLVPAFLGPLIAYLVDCKGMREPWMLVGAFALVIAHFGFYFVKQNGYLVFIIILSIGFSIAPAIVWSSFGLIVDVKYMGAAMGVAGSINAVGLFAVPVIAGKLVDMAGDDVVEYKKYQSAEMLWISCSMVALLSTIVWCYWLTKMKKL